MTNRLVRHLLAAAAVATLGRPAVVVPGVGDDPHGAVTAADQRTYPGGRL